jgi:hypothetical protein
MMSESQFETDMTSRRVDPMGRRVAERLGLVLPTCPTSEDQMLNLDLTGTPASGEYATVYLVFELELEARADATGFREVEALHDRGR